MNIKAKKLGWLKAALLTAFCACGVLCISVSPALALSTSVSVVKTGFKSTEARVASDPAGIECGASCFGEFTLGQKVTLTAKPAPGGVVGSWSGVTCEGEQEGESCTFLPAPAGGSTAVVNFVETPPLPTARTGAAAEVNYYYAKLEGTVNPQGNKVRNCRFEYGPTPAYGQSTPCVPATIGSGKADVAVQATVSPLVASTTYHFRLVAGNVAGDASGEDHTFATSASPISDSCPNVAVRAEQGIQAQLLPNCMAFEKVSPDQKFQSLVQGSSINSDGGRVYFKSGAALGNAPSLNAISSYLSGREAGGWGSPVAILPPSQFYNGFGNGGPQPLSLTPDFSTWAMAVATPSQAGSGIGQIFREGVDGGREALSPLFVPRGGEPFAPIQVEAEGGDADLRHVFFLVRKETAHDTVALLPGDPVATGYDPTGTTIGDNAYEAYLSAAGEPSLALVARDETGKVWGGRCGTFIGGKNPGEPQQGAVSADGSRVFFSTAPAQPEGLECDGTYPERILRRVQTPSGFQITDPIVSECTRVSPPCETADGDDEFQAASADGTKLFFTTTRQLSNSDLDGGVATGTGNLTAGSNLVTGLTKSSTANFAVNELISGAGIPSSTIESGSGTTISRIAPGELELSAPASASGSGVSLTASPICDVGITPTADRFTTFPGPGCDLYMYDYSRPVGERLTQISAGDASDPQPGSGAEVVAVPAISGDGSHVYFVARGVLTPEVGPGGAAPISGEPNLYLWDRDGGHPDGHVVFIGTLQQRCLTNGGDDCAKWVGSQQSSYFALPMLGAGPGEVGVGGDGHILAFQTRASLLPADQDGGENDIYRYDADTGALTLISGGVPAGSRNGPFSVATPSERPFSTAEPTFAQFGRWVSEDGNTFAFTSSEALLPGYVEGESHGYVWHDGRLAVLPGPELSQLSVSQSGDEVAFTTRGRLVSSDTDTLSDTYVARAGGGIPAAVEAAPCAGEACQGSAPSQPPPAPPGTESFAGSGNPPAEGATRSSGHHRTRHKHRRKHHRHHRKPKHHSDRRGGRR